MRHVRWLTLGVGALLLLSACGSDALHSPSAKPTARGKGTAASQPAPGPLLTAAVKNLSKAPYLAYAFSGVDRYGPAAFMLDSDGKGDLAGSITTEGITTSVVDLDKDGMLYVEGTAMAAHVPNIYLPAGLPTTDWVELGPSTDGFYDALATTSVLQSCIAQYGRQHLTSAGRGKVDGVKVYLVKNRVSVSGNPTGTAGTYAITATGTPVLVGWTMTAEYGTESPACPGGPQAGVSAGLLTGKLIVSAPATTPSIVAPTGTIYQEPGRGYTGGGFGP